MPSADPSAPAPQAMVRVEALTEERLTGVLKVHNAFIGAGKGMCGGICPYACCPQSEMEFGGPFRRSPEMMETSSAAVREDGTVVGFAHMVLHGMRRDPFASCLHSTRPGEAYIEELAVSADARGQGVGTKLLERCEEMARARGATVLSLAVVKGNPAIRLYERFGFVRLPDEGVCTTLVVCCVIGLPHGQCGGYSMEKPLQ